MIGIQINQIAVWRPKRSDGVTVRDFAKGTRVRDGKDEVRTTAITHRYFKNYETKDKTPIKYSLSVLTYDGNQEEVEKDLDRIALILTEREVKPILESKGSFGFTDYFIKERRK